MHVTLLKTKPTFGIGTVSNNMNM